jgi:hypothetical protein
LKEKAQLNYDAAKMYEEFGAEFESIYFTPITENKDVEERLQKYNDLYTKMNAYSNYENIDGVNYITELIYFLLKNYFNGRTRQIEKNERFWVLDGKPNIDYENNYDIELNEYFKRDFYPTTAICENKFEPTFRNLFGLFKHEDEDLKPVESKSPSTKLRNFHINTNENSNTSCNSITIDISETDSENPRALQI